MKQKEIHFFLELQRRPDRGLNSQPLEPILLAVSGHRANHSDILAVSGHRAGATALTTRPFKQDINLAFDDERNLARWLHTIQSFEILVKYS
uniref:Uncharacterized protein n=1 Tax=Magallana gigas TaxID=29159 RepID=K1QL43_MAGGI